MNEERCQGCGKIHVEVATATKEEVESMQFLQRRIETAEQYLDKTKNPTVVAGALSLISETRKFQQDWWNEIGQKYSFSSTEREYFIDFGTNVIYYKED
jgi:CXXX repeat modification system protein